MQDGGQLNISNQNMSRNKADVKIDILHRAVANDSSSARYILVL